MPSGLAARHADDFCRPVQAHGSELAPPYTTGIDAQQPVPLQKAERSPVPEHDAHRSGLPARQVEPRDESCCLCTGRTIFDQVEAAVCPAVTLVVAGLPLHLKRERDSSKDLG